MTEYVACLIEYVDGVCVASPFPANCSWGLEEQVASLVLPAGAGNHLMDLLTKQFEFQSIDGCLVLSLGLVQEVFAFTTLGISMLRGLCPAMPCGGHPGPGGFAKRSRNHFQALYCLGLRSRLSVHLAVLTLTASLASI